LPALLIARVMRLDPAMLLCGLTRRSDDAFPGPSIWRRTAETNKLPFHDPTASWRAMSASKLHPL
jgi:hypothetical protein